MADQNTDPKSKKTSDSKEIIKNLGGLSKAIMIALANASGLKLADNPGAEKVRKDADSNITKFNSLIVEGGSLRSILSTIEKLPTGDYDAQKKALDSMKKAMGSVSALVKSVYELQNGTTEKPAIGAINTTLSIEPIKELIGAMKDNVALDTEQEAHFITKNKSKDEYVLKKKLILGEKDGDNDTLKDVMMAELKTLKTPFDQNLANLQAAVNKLGTVKSIIESAKNTYTTLAPIVSEFEALSTKNLEDIFGKSGSGGILNGIKTDLTNASLFTFEDSISQIFLGKQDLDDTVEKNWEQYESVVLDDNGVPSEENKKLVTEKKWRLKKGKTKFADAIGRLTGSVNALKPVGVPIKSYIDVWATVDKNTKRKTLSTKRQVEAWSIGVADTNGAIRAVFEDQLPTIKDSLRIAAGFGLDENIVSHFTDKTAGTNAKLADNWESYEELVLDKDGKPIEKDGKLDKTTKMRLKSSKTPFTNLINGLTGSVNALKPVGNPIHTFIDVWATIDKSTKRKTITTQKQVEIWDACIKNSQAAINKVFADDGILPRIVTTLETVRGFKVEDDLINHFVDAKNPTGQKNDKGKEIFDTVKSPFAKYMLSLTSATKSLGQTRQVIDAFVGTFASAAVYETEDKMVGGKMKTVKTETIKQAAKDSITQVTEWESAVDSSVLAIEGVLGNGGILDKIKNCLSAIKDNNPSFPSDLAAYFVDAEDLKDANGDVVTNKSGKVVKDKTQFGKLIANYIVAIKAVGGVTKIATEVITVGKNIQESFSGEFGKNLGIIKSFAKGDKLALVVTMLGEIKAAMDAGWKDAEQKLGDKSSWKDSKGQSIADGAKAVSPWGENIANLTKMIKSIGDIAKIPKQAATTKAALDKADFKDLKANMSSISGRVSEMMTELDGSFQSICDEIMKTDLPKIAKESVDAITNFNALLQNITNLIENIAKSGETLDNISYRQLVHASVKIDFFMDILVDLIDDLKESSQTLTDRAPEINDLNKRITASIQPILNIFNMIEQMTEAIVKQGPLSERRTKKKIKTAGRNVQTMMLWVVDEFENLAAEIQKEMPSEKEKQRTFDEIMEPIKNLIEVMKLIMETKIPFVVKFKLKIWLLRNRIRYIAEQMEDLNKQLESIHKPSSNNVVKEVQQSIMQVQMIMESFNTISGVSLKILMKAWAIKPALEMVVKTLDAFDGLIKKIDELKDPKEANNKLAKFQEVIKGVMMLALSCLLLIPILAVFIVVSPILVAGLLLFAGAMWLITKIVDWTIGAKTGLMLGELGLVILALVGIAMVMLVLALFAEPLVKGFPMIMLFFLGLVGFVLLLAAFGLVVSLAWPLMLVAIAGIAIIALSVVAILIIALCLKALETIDLDTKKIKTSVQLVLSTAIEVMNLAFSPVSDPRGPQQDVGFLEVIGGTVVNIIRALAACIILVFTMISVVAILIIAVMLRMLAWIDMKELENGKKNAETVLGLAASIVNTLFAKPKTTKQQSKDEDLWSGLLTYVFKPLGQLIKVIFAVAYLAVMIVAVALIALLVMQLRIIAMFDQTMLEKGKENATLAVQTALEIVNMLFQPDDADKTESGRTGLLCVVGWVFGQEVENIIRAVFAIAYVGLLLISMVLISALVKQMEEIGKIKTETLTKAKTNAQSVVKTSVEIMRSLFEDSDAESGKGEGWLKKVLKWVLPDKLVDMIDAIIKIGMLALMIVGVGAIAKLAEMLNQVATFSVTPDQAKAKARQIIGAATSLFSNLKSMSDESNFEAKDADNMMDLCDTLALFPTKITPIGDNILKLLKYSEDEVNQATANCQNIINSIYKVLSDLDKMVLDDARVDKRLDLIDRLSDSIAGFTHVTDKDVKNTQDITDNYIKFLKQVDGMDLKKLQHTDWLMRSWASISRDLQGNFEGLARTINQHVMPVLDTLNKTMDEVKECQRQIIEDLTKPVDINGTGGAGTVTPPTEQSGINPGNDAPGVDAQGKLDNSVASDGKVGSDQRRTTAPPKNNGTYSDPIGQQVNPSGKVWKLTLPAGNYLLKKT